ncbi:hypothetical protein CRUP_025647 [Coryphaenoides rupestris]|nr:hypothetical protein CRUP_025647 [Coryphaenoides rupestris]
MAKEELRKIERLQYEAGLRLSELDGLTNQNRLLDRVFDGAVRSRLLAMTRGAGRRWDDLATALDVRARHLQSVVSEREEFEAERAELSLWLADLDARLSELEQQTGSTCSKMKELQACVCVNSQRVGVLLERGEAMMQRSAPPDDQEVFEDDSILSHAPDSGCPSESLLDEEGALDKPTLDLPSSTPLEPPSSSPPAPLSSTPRSPELELEHNVTSWQDVPPDHLGLEWDPSVDIGRSVTRGDRDSAYFSANTGVCSGHLSLSGGGGASRWRRPSSPGSGSDVFDDITNQEVDSVREPISFDGGRVRAWLGVQSSPSPSQRTSCSRGVQTDNQSHSSHHDDDDDSPLPGATTLSGPTHLRALSLGSGPRGLSWQPGPSLACLLLAVALTLLACLLWGLLELPCHRGNRFPLGHLALTYVNGPPPT